MPGELNSPYRRDPFTGDFYPRWNEADEVHQATLQESNGRVGFFLNEAPQLRIPSDFICMLLADEYDEYGTALRENARLDAPDTDEFRVDYDAEDYFGTGFVEVNADLVGSWFLVGYWGLGTPPRWETYYNARVNVGQDSAIEGDLIVGRKLAVVDEYDAEMFSAEGAVISAHGNRVRNVADAVDDNDAVNKKVLGENIDSMYAAVQYLFGWDESTASPDSFVAMAAAQDGADKIFIALNANQFNAEAVIRSDDGGASWSLISVPENANDWRAVAFGDGVFVAVSADGSNRVMRSEDYGASWSAVSAAEANAWYGVAYGGGVWVSVAASGTNRVQRSVDGGETWSAIAAASANTWRDVAYGDGVFVAVSDSTDAIMRSTDLGLTWTQVSVSVSNTKIVFGNGVFVINSGTTYVQRSTDLGITWETAQTVASGNLLRSVYANGAFLISADASGGAVENAKMYFSVDYGETWGHIYWPLRSWVAGASVGDLCIFGASGAARIMINQGL